MTLIHDQGIIIWRIWRVDSRSTRYMPSGASLNQPRYLRKVIRVIAESGAVYTLMVLLTFIICTTGSLALYPMSDMVSWYIWLISKDSNCLVDSSSNWNCIQRDTHSLSNETGQAIFGLRHQGPARSPHTGEHNGQVNEL
jgi:hypothetical protein